MFKTKYWCVRLLKSTLCKNAVWKGNRTYLNNVLDGLLNHSFLWPQLFYVLQIDSHSNPGQIGSCCQILLREKGENNITLAKLNISLTLCPDYVERGFRWKALLNSAKSNQPRLCGSGRVFWMHRTRERQLLARKEMKRQDCLMIRLWWVVIASNISLEWRVVPSRGTHLVCRGRCLAMQSSSPQGRVHASCSASHMIELRFPFTLFMSIVSFITR